MQLTQEETVKGDDFVGSVDKRGDDKYDPEERTSAVVGIVVKEMPLGLTIVE